MLSDGDYGATMHAIQRAVPLLVPLQTVIQHAVRD